MQNRMNIAMYLRLSKEDDRNTQESNSISCQRLLLKEYIEQNFRGKILSDEVCQPKACITGCPEGDTIWILLPATIGCRLHRICPRGNGMFRS